MKPKKLYLGSNIQREKVVVLLLMPFEQGCHEHGQVYKLCISLGTFSKEDNCGNQTLADNVYLLRQCDNILSKS
jgi:hypothetical protein